MKRISCDPARLCSALACLFLLITSSFAQSDGAGKPPVLMEREREMEMALSAAPEHLRKEAAVYVLQRGGYVKAREGANGFTCLVQREGANGTSPICYDAEGSRTTLLADLRRGALREQGKSEQEVEKIIAQEYQEAKLRAPQRPGVAYMLSTEFKTHDHQSGKMVTVFPPHVMFYAPYLKNSDIGARPEHRGSESQPWILNEGKPWAYIIVVPKEKR